MDDQELEFRRREADALRRWLALEEEYARSLPKVHALAPGQRIPDGVVLTEEYIARMASLDERRGAVRRELEDIRKERYGHGPQTLN